MCSTNCKCLGERIQLANLTQVSTVEPINHGQGHRIMQYKYGYQEPLPVCAGPRTPLQSLLYGPQIRCWLVIPSLTSFCANFGIKFFWQLLYLYFKKMHSIGDLSSYRSVGVGWIQLAVCASSQSCINKYVITSYCMLCSIKSYATLKCFHWMHDIFMEKQPVLKDMWMGNSWSNYMTALAFVSFWCFLSDF